MEKPGAARARWGLVLVLGSAAAYGTMPILGKLAYAAGVRPLTLLAWRFVIAAALFAAFRSRTGPRLALRRRIALWLVGVVFVANAFAYFGALERVPASLVALLLYTYPVFVTLFSAAAGFEPLTARGVAAAVLVFGGAALTAGQPAGAVAPGGVPLTLTAAVLYAAYIVLSGIHAADLPSELAAEHIAQSAAVLFVCGAAATGELVVPSFRGALLIVAIGLLCTVFALRAFLAGLARVGPSRAAVASSFEILVTMLLAVLVLREAVGARQCAGAALIVVGVAVQNLLRAGMGRET